MEQAVIAGIAFNRDEAKITVVGVPDRPGVAYAILGPVGDANIDVDMIIQNASVNGLTDFSFTVNRNEYQKAIEVLNTQVKEHIKAPPTSAATTTCARSRWWASACAPTPASPPRCSAPWPRKASTSR